MPVSEYGRARLASSSKYGPGHSRNEIDEASDDDSIDLDFEAYKNKHFPSERLQHQAVGMASASGNGSIDSLAGANTRSRTNSNSSFHQNTLQASILPPPGTRRLQNMRPGRAAADANPTRTPASSSGLRTSSLSRDFADVAPATGTVRSTSLKRRSDDTSPSALSNNNVTATIRKAPSPPSSPSSVGSDLSIADYSSVENGVAARKCYRELDAKAEVLREEFRRDPRNAGLPTYEMNQALKAVALPDPGEQELYNELRLYVLRDGKLGPCWDRHCAKQKASEGNDQMAEEEYDLVDEFGNEVPGADYDDGGGPGGPYHDAMEEPLAEVVDLASFERPRSKSTDGTRHSRLRSIATSDIPAATAPLSATGSISGRPYGTGEDQMHGATRPGAMPTYRLPANSSSQVVASQYGSGQVMEAQLPSPGPPESEEEDDVPIEGRALNDTLQLRSQRKAVAPQLPPNTIIYEPPPPPMRSLGLRRESPIIDTIPTSRPTRGEADPRHHRSVSDDRVQAGQASSVAAPAVTTGGKGRRIVAASQNARPGSISQIPPSQVATSQSGHPSRLNRSGSRKKAVEEQDGPIPRPGSSKSMRGEDERPQRVQQYEVDNMYGDEAGAGANYASTARPPMSHQGSYQDARGLQPHPQQQQLHHSQQPQRPQHDQYSQHMYDPNTPAGFSQLRSSHPMQAAAGQNPVPLYGNSSNSAYGQTGQGSSPIEFSRQSQPDPRTNPAPNGASGPSSQPAPKNTVTVNRNQYARLELIGKGGSSKVYRVLRMKDYTQFAMKKVDLSNLDEEAMQGYRQEISILKRLSGRNSVVKLIDEEMKGKGQSSVLFVIMELGEMDFSRLLVERQGESIYIPWITIYFKQMLEAVQVIHDERIIHSDLKPANFILVRGRLKLIDFGIAKAIANDTTNIQRDSQIGTLNYMSPEAMNSAPGEERLKIGRASDVWSLGCILYQMVYGAAPFASITNLQQKMVAIGREDHKIAFPDYSVPMVRDETGKPVPRQDLRVLVPEDMIQTMQKCLRRDSKQRPDVPQLLTEPWINGRSIVEKLGDDEAVISRLHMTELLNYAGSHFTSNWNPELAQNVELVNTLVEAIMPQLQGMRSGYIS